MSRIAERIAKLEANLGAHQPTRRIVRHVLNCAPAERPERVAAIRAENPSAFHIVRVIVRPGEEAVTA